MKLSQSDIVLDTSEEMPVVNYGIGDPGMAMYILRKKLYSDPIRAAIQEPMSNARDANREVGKADVPIEVTAPTLVSPVFIVKDSGPGISKDRMEKVATQFGNSTKRKDNKQTGGFGIGMKAPWAYTETFIIETIAKEKTFLSDGVLYRNVNVKRIYSNCVGKDNIGRADVMYESLTEEPTGTVIKIPVKQSDINGFHNRILKTCQFWSVKPILNNTKHPCDPEEVVSGDKWVVCDKVADASSTVGFFLVDEIPYPVVDLNLSRDNSASQLQYMMASNSYAITRRLVIKANVGEIDVSANREQIEINDKLKSFMAKVYDDISRVLKDKVEEKLKTITCLPDAFDVVDKTMDIFPDRLLSVKIMWNGIDLWDNRDRTIIAKDYNFAEYRLTYKGNLTKRNSTSDMICRQDLRRLILNDDEPNIRCKIKYHLNTSNFTRVHVLHKLATPPKEYGWNAKNYLKFEDIYKYLDVKKLSTLPMPPNEKAKTAVAKTPFALYNLTYGAKANTAVFDRIKCEDILTIKGQVVARYKNRSLLTYKNDYEFSDDDKYKLLEYAEKRGLKVYCTNSDKGTDELWKNNTKIEDWIVAEAKKEIDNFTTSQDSMMKSYCDSIISTIDSYKAKPHGDLEKDYQKVVEFQKLYIDSITYHTPSFFHTFNGKTKGGEQRKELLNFHKTIERVREHLYFILYYGYHSDETKKMARAFVKFVSDHYKSI